MAREEEAVSRLSVGCGFERVEVLLVSDQGGVSIDPFRIDAIEVWAVDAVLEPVSIDFGAAERWAVAWAAGFIE